MFRCSYPACALLWVASLACGEPAEKEISIVRISPSADPACGAPADARSMIIRALGEFPASEATAQSIVLGIDGDFAVDRFPPATRMLEVAVTGFGGALRAIGRSHSFSIPDLAKDEEIPILMAPLDGVCKTGPTLVERYQPLLARAGEDVLVAGGSDAEGNPVVAVERYQTRTGRFLAVDGVVYGDTSAQGLLGASMSELSTGDVVLVGGAATAYQVYSLEAQSFSAPAFYREARGHHAATVLADDRIFLAGGCSQLTGRSCSNGSQLLTTSLLDAETGEIEQGPTLQLPRIGGSAWLESGQSILLVGGVDADGVPVSRAERVFLDGRESRLIDGLSGVSTRSASGTIWAGLAGSLGDPSVELGALASGMKSAAQGLSAAFADSDAHLVGLEDGSILAVGARGAQRVRTLDGASTPLDIAGLEDREGQAAIRLGDGTVLLVGGPDAFVYRPSLVGPLSASALVSFSSLDLSEGLSARNPDRVSVEPDGVAQLELSLDEDPEEWVLLSGPHFAGFRMEVSASVDGAALLLLFGWESAGDHWRVILEPGSDATLQRVRSGQASSVPGCTASAIDALSLVDDGGGTGHEISLQAAKGRIEVGVDGDTVLTCAPEELPSVGEVGIGLQGRGGDSLRVGIISVGR